nr:MAG TPA: hypothetical protein [Caudoviricetes sp.]
MFIITPLYDCFATCRVARLYYWWHNVRLLPIARSYYALAFH